jgi:hypothetical protein
LYLPLLRVLAAIHTLNSLEVILTYPGDVSKMMCEGA